MKKNLFILVFILVFLITSIIVIILNNRIYVSLKGDSYLQVEYANYYDDEGIILKRGIKYLRNYKMKKYHNVDTNELLCNDVLYVVEYKGKNYYLRRQVDVLDKEGPVIMVNLDKVKKDYCTGKIIGKFKYRATDNYDGNLTKKIKMTDNDDEIILEVTDSNGNYSKKKLLVEYTEKPADKFVLNGDDTIYVLLNDKYEELGASLKDGCDNQLKADIKISGMVDTSKIGEYEVTYELEGYKKLTRKVIVYEVSFEHKLIYLTFDDGPGYYTQSILNTLKKYNVKATFFVTNQFPDYQYLIGEEYKQGHKIAVHTFSHNYAIYSSVDTYINDFNQMNEIVKKYTGSYSNLFRFPGGSSNTISARYSYGVVSAIASEMTNRGYIYFDWNADSTDAAGSSAYWIYQNVMSNIEDCSRCVILMHDIKGTTAEALDGILSTFKRRGYSFATLDENSPTTHHRIAN